MKSGIRRRCHSVLLWLLACLVIGGTSGCHILKKKQDRERFERSQVEFSCGEPMPPAKAQ